jgi:hypothetical protein
MLGQIPLLVWLLAATVYVNRIFRKNSLHVMEDVYQEKEQGWKVGGVGSRGGRWVAW